jgi:hypothetical protein
VTEQEQRRALDSSLKDVTQRLERKEYEFGLSQQETTQLRQGNQALDQTKYS